MFVSKGSEHIVQSAWAPWTQAFQEIESILSTVQTRFKKVGWNYQSYFGIWELLDHAVCLWASTRTITLLIVKYSCIMSVMLINNHTNYCHNDTFLPCIFQLFWSWLTPVACEGKWDKNPGAYDQTPPGGWSPAWHNSSTGNALFQTYDRSHGSLSGKQTHILLAVLGKMWFGGHLLRPLKCS